MLPAALVKSALFTASRNSVLNSSIRSCLKCLATAAKFSDDPNARLAPEFVSKLQDPTILKTAGYVDGKWLQASDGTTFEVHNPATGKAIAQVPKMKQGETAAAVAAAHAVFPQWSQMIARDRGVVLKKWYQEILKNADDLATIMTAECGKPTAEAKAEVASGAASVEWFAEEGRRVAGDVLESTSRDRRMLTLKQPVGVVAAITPWNFPMSMITRKVAPALAAGCTAVLKPSELTPLTALALAELAERAGLPDGVLNIVMGDAPAIGNTLISSETVRKIGFTGSTGVGKQLMAAAAGTVKRVSLELGGNAPLIVFEDADLDRAAAGIVASALRNAGQTCICTNRVFVHEAVAEPLTAAIRDRVAALKLGDGAEPGITHGPLITPAAVDKVIVHVQDALAKGGQLVIGGAKPDALPEALAGGNFYQPTVVANATFDMKCFREETFGPLIPLFKFSSEEEALMLANDTEYGLASYFFTRDLSRAWRVAERLEYGMVGVNEVAITSEVAPFGGIKQSGLGREQSKYGIDEYLEVKYVCMGAIGS